MTPPGSVAPRGEAERARVRTRRALGATLLLAGAVCVLHALATTERDGVTRDAPLGGGHELATAARQRVRAVAAAAPPRGTEVTSMPAGGAPARRGVRLVAADGGAPIDGARLCLLPRTSDVAEPAHLDWDAERSDCGALTEAADGVFEVPASGPVVAIASAPGFADARVSLCDGPGGVVVFALHRSRTVHVRTVDDATGRGLACAIEQRVRRGLDRSRLVARTRSDEGGFASVAADPQSGVTTTLLAYAEGYDVGSTTLPSSSTAGESAEDPIELRLSPSESVSVRVVTAADGRGLAGARLTSDGRVVSVSDAFGDASVPAPAPGWSGSVRVECAGYGDELLLVPAEARDAEDAPPLIVALREPWEIDGFVTDERRRPIAGAAVWLEARAEDPTGVASVAVRCTALCDARGAFRLTGIPVRTSLQRARLGAVAPDGRRTAQALDRRPGGPVDIVLDADSLPIDLALAAVDAHGVPVRDAEIGAWFVAGADPTRVALVAEQVRAGLECDRRFATVDSGSGVARLSLHGQSGVWIARAWSQDSASAMVVVAPRSGHAVLRMERVPIVSGSLRTPGSADRRALHVDVVSESDGRVLAADSSGPDGSFDLPLARTLRPDESVQVRVRESAVAGEVLATSKLGPGALDRRVIIDVARR